MLRKTKGRPSLTCRLKRSTRSSAPIKTICKSSQCVATTSVLVELRAVTCSRFTCDLSYPFASGCMPMHTTRGYCSASLRCSSKGEYQGPEEGRLLWLEGCAGSCMVYLACPIVVNP